MTPKVNLIFLGIGLFFIGGVVTPMAWVPGTMIAVFGVGMVIYHFISTRRDPYSIASLREFEEREQTRALIEATGRAEGDVIVCPRCLEPYDAELPICPNCRNSC